MKQLKDFGFEIFYDASLLGEEWDIIAADNIFLKKNSLVHLQNVNPCNQKYYINEKMGIIFVSYKLKLNIFTLKRGLDIKLPVTIIGIPFSVSYKGYSYSKQNCDILSYTIKSLKGIKLVLNADEDLNLPKGYTLPQYTLDIHWSTFEQYVDSMRSHYRYRVRKALSSFKKNQNNLLDIQEAFHEHERSFIKNHEKIMITEILEDKMNFSKEMYNLYLEVYENSKDKLEKLTIDYFRTYPSVIILFYIIDAKSKIPAGFVQLSENSELIFLFAGLNHDLNIKYDIYINMLLYIIRYAIENKYKKVNLGQTTMDTKQKLGAVSKQKYMYITSENPLLRMITPFAAKLLSYKEMQQEFNVFKNLNVINDETQNNL